MESRREGEGTQGVSVCRGNVSMFIVSAVFPSAEIFFHWNQHQGPIMPSLLVVVFLLQLLINLINTIGAPAINTLVSLISYPRFPSPQSARSVAKSNLNI